MDRKRVLKFKKELQGVPLKFTTDSGDIVRGHLATNKIEKDMISHAIKYLPFGAKKLLNEYFCLINYETKKASFLLASDIETIDIIV